MSEKRKRKMEVEGGNAPGCRIHHLERYFEQCFISNQYHADANNCEQL